MWSASLEVAIGLVLVYWIMSMFCSTVNEWIASVTNLRARTLKSSINALLASPDGTGLASAFHSHPLIRALTLEKKYASYIPSQTFALALLDLAVTGKRPDAGNPTSLKPAQVVNRTQTGGSEGIAIGTDSQTLVGSLLMGVENDVAAAQTRVAKWFDDSMDRVSGLYKRRVQLIIVALAAVVTLALDVDTVRIAHQLWSDPTARGAIVAQAQTAVSVQRHDSAAQTTPIHAQDSAKRPTAATPATNATNGAQVKAETETGVKAAPSGLGKERSTSVPLWQSQLDALEKSLPLGWTDCSAEPSAMACTESFWAHVAGLVLSVIAISLGAPFWFELLTKLVNLRQTGTPPDETSDAKTPVVTRAVR